MFPMADLEKTANVNSGPAPPQKKKKNHSTFYKYLHNIGSVMYFTSCHL